MSHSSDHYKRNILVIFAANSNNIFYAVWKHSRYRLHIIDVKDQRNVRTVKILSAAEFLQSIEKGEYILPTQNQQSLADANDYKIGILTQEDIIVCYYHSRSGMCLVSVLPDAAQLIFVVSI